MVARSGRSSARISSPPSGASPSTSRDPTEFFGIPNPFFVYQPYTFFLDMLPYALVILIMVLGAREAMKRRVGAPAALGIPWVRGERGM